MCPSRFETFPLLTTIPVDHFCKMKQKSPFAYRRNKKHNVKSTLANKFKMGLSLIAFAKNFHWDAINNDPFRWKLINATVIFRNNRCKMFANCVHLTLRYDIWCWYIIVNGISSNVLYHKVPKDFFFHFVFDVKTIQYAKFSGCNGAIAVQHKHQIRAKKEEHQQNDFKVKHVQPNNKLVANAYLKCCLYVLMLFVLGSNWHC